VSLTAPANGATFSAPATVALSASASDPDGTVAQVAFYRGTTLIGTSTTAPHGVSWANVTAGTYDLTAKATDNLGATTTSAVARITVSSGGNITITSPVNGAALYGGSVTVSGIFNGDSTTTVLVDNGNSTRLATLNGNGFSATVPLFLGANTLNILVSRRDRTYDTASLTVTGNDMPRIAWQSPTTTSFDAPATLTFAVDAVSATGSISKVEFYRDSTSLATVTTPPYETVLSSLGTGTYTLSAIATDNHGQTTSASRMIQVRGPNLLPTASLWSPVSGAVYTAPATLVLEATASDPDGWIVQVEFLREGEVVATTNAPPYAVTLSDVAAGGYTYSVRATDNRGGKATSTPVSVTVVPPNAAPTVVLNSPANGSTFIAPAAIGLAATATDSDGTIAKVEFFHGSTLIGSATAEPYTFNWTHVPAGSYQLTARATDNAGGTATTAVAELTVLPNSAPTVSVSSSTDGATVYAPARVVLSATAADSDGSIARVEFFAGATLVGTTTVAPHAVTWRDVAAGSYSVTAVAYDGLGASAVSSPVTVTISAPTLTLATPVNGDSVSGDSVLVSGTLRAPPNTGVTVNGVVAALTDDHRFYARVPLMAGANPIEAMLTTQMGQTATQSITLTADGIPSSLQVTHGTLEGLAPLAATFELENGGTGDSTVQVNDGTPFTLPPGITASVSLPADGPGVQLVRIAATDDQGRTVVRNFAVVANDRVLVDQKFKALWAGMNDAVSAGDMPAALSHLSMQARAKYGPVFEVLQADYAQIAASFSPMRAMSLSPAGSEYTLNRTLDGENHIFFIYFLRDLHGVWRLDSM
jgi:hypothetical protein